MKNLFRTLGISFFLTACALFALLSFKIITASEVATTVDKPNTTQQATQTTKTTQTVRTSAQATRTTQTGQTSSQSTTSRQETNTAQNSTAKIKFTVNSEDTSYTVAEKLLAQGVIKNVDEFSEYMINNNLSQYIQTGTFELRKDMPLQELGKTLTTYPGN